MHRLVAVLICLGLAAGSLSSLAGPHEDGMTAGRAANPVAHGSVNAASATDTVPGYTTAPPEVSYYRQPNLAAQGNARLALCAAADPVCQAQRNASVSAATARPTVGTADPAVLAAAAISSSPSSVLDSIATYYSGCTTTTTTIPATTRNRSCLRYEGLGAYPCTRDLAVVVDRSTSCTPGEWFAHAGSDSAGIDVQCLPDRAAGSQHFRVTQAGAPVAFFDVDMTAPVVFPQIAALLSTSTSWDTGADIRTGVWVVDKSCSGDNCALTAMIAAERAESCTGTAEAGMTCTSVEPFLRRYAACPTGTESGDQIRDTVCSGDLGCTTTALDGSRCYAPSDTPTELSGIDATGAISGIYWTQHSVRTVVGWEVNPTYGPIPVMHLDYQRPTTAVATSDSWDDRCPAVGGRCTVQTAAVCTDGPSTKIVDGIEVTRDCWRYETSMRCEGTTAASDCGGLVAAGCSAGASVCRRTNTATGVCEVWEDGYACPGPAQTVTAAANCPSNVFCLQGNCFDLASPADADFARSLSMLEAAREGGVYLDTDRMQVFKGEANRCRDRLLRNCCYADSAGAGMSNQSLFGTGSRLVFDILMNAENREFVVQGLSALLTGGGFNGSFTSYGVTVTVNGAALPAGSVVVYAGDSIVVAFDPWTLAVGVLIQVAMSAASCDEEEGKLAMKEGARLCHSVGTYCSSCIRILGSCVSCITHTTGKCCFNSMLARIVNEQGRVQVGKGWGSPEAPDCSGFTIAQLQSLDFAAMDLREFYASLVPTLPSVSVLEGQSAGRVPACYYGQGRCQ